MPSFSAGTFFGLSATLILLQVQPSPTSLSCTGAQVYECDCKGFTDKEIIEKFCKPRYRPGVNYARPIILRKHSEDTVKGTSESECIIGTHGADKIQGNGGDDIIFGLSGNDLIDGGPGRDIIHGGCGDDILVGGNGDDTINGEEGNDQLDGGLGNDELAGEHGDDALTSNSGCDILSGGIGEDSYSIGNAGIAAIRDDDQANEISDLKQQHECSTR